MALKGVISKISLTQFYQYLFEEPNIDVATWDRDRCLAKAVQAPFFELWTLQYLKASLLLSHNYPIFSFCVPCIIFSASFNLTTISGISGFSTFGPIISTISFDGTMPFFCTVPQMCPVATIRPFR